MPAVGSPYSYSFEGQKTNVPLAVDAATGPEGHKIKKDAATADEGPGSISKREVKGVYRRGRRGRKH